jgi:hypothetical protein
LVTVSARAQSYSVAEVGTLPDATPLVMTPPTSQAEAITESGVVAGSSAISGGSMWISPNVQIAEPWFYHAIRWTNGTVEDLGVLGQDVGPDDFPRPATYAHGINNLQQIVGDATVLTDGWYHAFVWLPTDAYGMSSGMHELPILATQAHAWAISDYGVVVGESRLPGSLGPRAVRWDAANGQWVVSDLGSFSQAYSIAYGSNNLNQITGYATVIVPPGQSNTHAFLWLPAPAYGLPAGLNNLTAGLPAGSIGRDVNELGQVVGRGPDWRPIFWLPAPAYGLPAGVTQLSIANAFSPQVLAQYGLLAPFRGEFTGVNNHGVAVGTMDFPFQLPNGNYGTATRGIVWKNGQFLLTQQLLPPDSAAQYPIIYRTDESNDAGQIVATALNANSEGRGLVLTPVPTSGDCDADMGIDLADYQSWRTCLTGPMGAITSDCVCTDINGDNDSDLADFAAFQLGFSGP